MATNTVIRHRIIKYIQDKPEVKYQEVLARFHVSLRNQARDIISQMIGDGFLTKFGDGTRGDPIKLYHGIKWDKNDVCPLCNGSGVGYRAVQ